MNSKVIKFVAGGGKTTFAEKIMKENKNGIYLAFNNSVVDEIANRGLLSKTIDGLFVSFIIPKLIQLIPLIANGAKINYKKLEDLPPNQKGIGKIKIDKDGKLFNCSKEIPVTLNMENSKLHRMENVTNIPFIKKIFKRESLNITDQLRDDLSSYIVKMYPNEIIKLLKERFSFIIIDEAQDLKSYREEFAKLIFESDINFKILGDDNQNINGGGKWFEELEATSQKVHTYRCPEKVCKWIRDNLEIDIFGTEDKGDYIQIENSEVMKYDNGNRTLLFCSNTKSNREIIDTWKGDKQTIKKAKGSTINGDIVIIGKSLSKKNLYTAITRTTKNCYSTVKKINK